MSDKLPANFNHEKAGTETSEQFCESCEREPCECQRLEDEMDERRMERMDNE